MFWYRKAAEQGEDGAQFNLGLLYDNGRGVAQDYVQAYMWYYLAAIHHDVSAASFRDSVAKIDGVWDLALWQGRYKRAFLARIRKAFSALPAYSSQY